MGRFRCKHAVHLVAVLGSVIIGSVSPPFPKPPSSSHKHGQLMTPKQNGDFRRDQTLPLMIVNGGLWVGSCR